MSEQDPLLTHEASSPETGVENSNSNKVSRYYRWQNKLAHFLESPTLHKIIFTLIVIDASCVLADLTYTFLSPSCDKSPGEEGTPLWLFVLSQISITITTLFLVEIPLNFWAFGLNHVNPFGPVPHASLHIFDIVVILTTFIGEAVLRGKEREIAGLLIFLRLWRLVKLVGGVAVGAGELQEQIEEELAVTKTALDRTKAKLAELQEENFLLKQDLSQFRPNPDPDA